LVRIGSGMFRNLFTTFVLLWNHPAGVVLRKKNVSNSFEHGHFAKMTYGRKLNFLVTYLERYLIKVVRMDRTNHLGFQKK